VPSKQVSAKNQAAHTKLKFRQEGQAAPHELQEKEDLKAKLEAKEREHFKKKGISFEEQRKQDLQLLEAAPPDEGGGGSGRALMPYAKDADDVDPDADDDDSSSDEDDDSDDEAELKAELERIRAERAAEAEKRAAEEEAKRQEAIRAEVLGGNPLMAGAEVDFGMKRRWDEDVVFKNQTRGEVKAPRRFINDTVRSDFHRRFLERYIR
jgi:protein CWC15